MPGPWERYAKAPVQPTAIQSPGKPWERYSPAASSEAAAPMVAAPVAPQPADTGILHNLKEGITGPQGLGQFLVGAGKGAVSTAANLSGMIDSGVRHVLPNLPQPTSVNAAKQWAVATPNTAQGAGKTAEQIGEFFVPGPGEEAAATHLAAYAPQAAKAIRLGVKAVGSGAVNKAQGGSFTGGAVAGGVGEGVAQAATAVAPKLAEIGMRVRASDKGFGRDLGATILRDTTGIRPSTVAAQAKDAINARMNTLADLAAQSDTPVSLAPARTSAKASFGEAVAQNNDQGIRDMSELNEQLASRPLAPGVRGAPKTMKIPIAQAQTTGWAGPYQKAAPTIEVPARAAIPEQVSAPEAVALKRGVGALDSKWSATGAPDSYTAAVHNVYRGLDGEIDKAVPGSAAINENISNLIPVAKRATATDLNAGVIERVAGRFGAHSGALLGGVTGYHFGGIPGAVVGLVGPEAINSPETWMTGARLANSSALRRVVLPSAVAGSLQFDRSSK